MRAGDKMIPVPVVSFVGYANNGKTTFVIKVISEMKRRGYKVGIIKHDVHGFEIDYPEKDTWRHAQAGADIVCISASNKVAYIRRVAEERALDLLIQDMSDMDIVFTEGFKKENKPQIEVYRQQSGKEALGKRENLLAVVSDLQLYDEIPFFGFEDEVMLCDFLVQHFRIKNGRNAF